MFRTKIKGQTLSFEIIDRSTAHFLYMYEDKEIYCVSILGQQIDGLEFFF